MADATEVEVELAVAVEVDPEVEGIKQQMVEQRGALADKLESLETQVTASVGQATAAVSQAVDTVSGTLQASVDTVRDAFDVRLQVERHPWAMVGGSVAVGVLGAWLLHGKKEGGERSPRAPAYNHFPVPPPPVAITAPPEPERPGWFAQIAEELRPEMVRLKGLAIGTLIGLVRDALVDVTPPQVRTEIGDVVDRITTKLGGEPVPGRVQPVREELLV